MDPLSLNSTTKTFQSESYPTLLKHVESGVDFISTLLTSNSLSVGVGSGGVAGVMAFSAFVFIVGSVTVAELCD
jgi:hypothetical protein